MGRIDTLRGPIDAGDLGPTLPHEHLPMHYFAWDSPQFEPGSKAIVRQWYPPLLDELLETPFRTLVDVTPIGHGRDIAFRQELLGRRDLNVVVSTGFYLDSHQPEWARQQPAEALEERLVHEIEVGIGDTGVRAGIIKLAPDPSSQQSRKVCGAAVAASRRTNARITTHSCSCGRQSFDLLVELGADPENLYIGHADFAEFEENRSICADGGHVLFTVWDIDYMIPDQLMYRRFAELVHQGHLERVLMSVDFAIMVHEPARPTFLSWTIYGIEGRTHAYLGRTVIPKLTDSYGLDDDQVRVITEANPRRMLDFRG